MGLALVVVVLLVVLIAVGSLVGIYNGLITLSNNVRKAWSNIDVLLKQRHDEIPKLVKVCEGYMAHEKGVFEKVMQSRQASMSAQGPAQQAQAESNLQGSLRQLFALAENYPDLKAQTSFQQLQNRVSELESQIADRREFYNDSVNVYNIRIATLPDLFIARAMALPPKEMFQVSATDREDVPISFSPTPGV
jgi:LemA protein